MTQASLIQYWSIKWFLGLGSLSLSWVKYQLSIHASSARRSSRRRHFSLDFIAQWLRRCRLMASQVNAHADADPRTPEYSCIEDVLGPWHPLRDRLELKRPRERSDISCQLASKRCWKELVWGIAFLNDCYFSSLHSCSTFSSREIVASCTEESK